MKLRHDIELLGFLHKLTQSATPKSLKKNFLETKLLFTTPGSPNVFSRKKPTSFNALTTASALSGVTCWVKRETLNL